MIPATPPSFLTPAPARQQPKLLDRLREALRSRHYSGRTEHAYCYWVKRFIFFHKVRHPIEMAEPEINAFLTHLAVKEKVSASTQNQALSALLFLYRHVLGRKVGDLVIIVDKSCCSRGSWVIGCPPRSLEGCGSGQSGQEKGRLVVADAQQALYPSAPRARSG